MIKDLTFDQEKKLANNLYYGGGYTKKYEDGGMFSAEGGEAGFLKGNYADKLKAGETAGRSDMSTLRKGTSFKGENTAGTIGAVAGAASGIIGEFDKTPDKYDNANIAQESLKYAAMGAAAGPIGAGVGALVGAGIGMVKKNKAEKEAKVATRKAEQNAGYESFMKDQEEFAGYKEGGTIKPSKELDYELDPAYRKIKAKYDNEAIQMKKILGDDFKDDFFNQFNSTYSDNTRVSTPDTDRLEMFRTNVEQDWENIPLEDRKTYMNTYKTGGMTKGAYSHSANPLTVVDKSGKPTGMELTGGEGVFDKPFMGKVKNLLAGGKYQEAGKAVQNEMNTWKHK